MKKGEWRIGSATVCGEKMWAVFRLRNTDECDKSGNREYATDWLTTREEAEMILDELKGEESDEVMENIINVLDDIIGREEI